MSLYNLMNGVTGATFFVLPMLGKHPDEYPRFRDCFTSDPEHPAYDDHIHVYTRTGGGNREHYAEQNAVLEAMPGFVATFDDSFDNTFATFVFKIPEAFKADYEKATTSRILETSAEYQALLRKVYPKLSEQLDELFGKKA